MGIFDRLSTLLRSNINDLITRAENPEKMQQQLPRIPLRRPGEPWEVARLALYLASEESDYVTGQSFTIDGGLEMNWGQGA